MRFSFLICCTAVAFLFCQLQLIAAEEVPTPVKASIVSDVSAVEPGKPFLLGVLFEVDPGWHIYWKNSGDTGLPTKVLFKLPEGFKPGAIQWPLPQMFKGAGGIVDYGYEDSLLLFTKVKVHDALETGSVVDIGADVSWVSCEEICIPGSGSLELKLPVSNKAEQINLELFSEWSRALPQASKDDRNPFKIDISKAGKDENAEIIKISLESESRMKNIELYPVPGDWAAVRSIRYDSKGGEGKTDIYLEIKSLNAKPAADAFLEALVVYTSPSNERSGVELSIPLGD